MLLLGAWAILLISIQECYSAYVEVTPREAVVLPGHNVTFLCKVGLALQYCRVEIPGMKDHFNLSPVLKSDSAVTYYGAGLEEGQCGATINRVTDINNGKVKCSLGVTTQIVESSTTMILTVARAPKTPELDLSRGRDAYGVYKLGEVLHASCLIKDGRPVANISWFLDDEPLLEDLKMPTIIDVAKDDLHSILQNFSRTLRASDNGKQLRCVAGHPALTNMNNQVARQLDVKYPPLPHDNPIDKFGYELGKDGIISLDIYANPRPILEWTIGDQKLKEGTVDSTGRLSAETSQDVGRGHYIATLRIAAITKHDTEMQYTLTAYNDQGSTEYVVVISTSPQPEGLEMSIGYIILILVCLLVILLTVFMLIFARVTGRWCFSGSNPGIRHNAESSDTESAEVRHKESKMKAPKLPFSSVFKKNKDKVAHEDETMKPMEVDESTLVAKEEAEKQTSEQQEGIVYAELDLVAQNLRPMVKSEEDKTEYAEIIYTQKPESETTETDKLKEEKKAT